MRLLVFGGWGQLGSDLAAQAEGRHDLIRPTHAEVDVTDPSGVERALLDHRPHVVIDVAAFHKVEACEEDPVQAFTVNTVGALHVARVARVVGARCVMLSSDYVFDGENPHGYTEDAPTAPLNVYGVSKAAGERVIRTACPDSLVIRGSGFFGHAGSSGKGGNFVEAMLAKGQAGEAVSVVDDQVFAPTATHDLAERILLFLERDVPPGIYHGANSGTCSWYRFARAIFELAGMDVEVTPRPAGEQLVRRPRSSILLDTMSAQLGLPPARHWRQALASYMQARAGRTPADAAGRS